MDDAVETAQQDQTTKRTQASTEFKRMVRQHMEIREHSHQFPNRSGKSPEIKYANLLAALTALQAQGDQ